MVLCHVRRAVQAHTHWDLPIPVPFGILVKRCKHNGQNSLDIVADKIAEVLIIPEVKCTFRHLEAVSDCPPGGLWSYLEVGTGH
jgi:hypothetical protein